MSSPFGRWMSTPQPGEEVVISGVSGHFPESRNIREFQENLFKKKDLVTDNRRYKLDHPEVPRRSGQVEDVDKLDAGYFGLHYRQTNIMDPMTRKMLECTIEAVMDAGVNPAELAGTRTAVLMGACYADMEIETLIGITQPQSFGITGYLRSFIANRISYFLKLKGTSCTVDTACSSSLNALENAFKSIRTGKCDNAIVGGVNILLHPGVTRQFFRLGVLSSDGTCKVFDEKADGYVRSETIACVFLQKAKSARRIYAKVIYSKSNGDGFKPLGITFPSTQMQQVLMTEVLEDSGVDSSQISFLEAHGTGTLVGDPQEIEAIDAAIAKTRTKPVLTGSVKCSIGHTEPASGLCSIAKIIIAMETGYIAPNIHVENIKKGMVGFEEGRMVLVTELTRLDDDDAIMGVNNFGFGGNNCHLLLERHRKTKVNGGLPEDDVPRLVCASGRTEGAVSSLLEDVNKKLDVEYVGLLHQIFKREVTGHVYRGFSIISKSGVVKTSFKPFSKKVSFYVFFGEFINKFKILGQYLMQFPSFQSTIKKMSGILSNEINTYDTLTKVRLQANEDTFGAFAVQIGILKVLELVNVEPTLVYGYSFGKIITAYYYHQITLEQAIHTICQIVVKNVKISDLYLDSVAENEIDVKDSMVLKISDDTNLIKDNKIEFLEELGRLYEGGHNLQLHKLYPQIQFPVSRSTPMISPLVQWDHRKSWYYFRFGVGAIIGITQKEHNLGPSVYKYQQYLLGHVIDGRNLVPAAEYLELVRKTFVESFGKSEIDSLIVVFENCKFIRALSLPKTNALKLLVSIQKSSGYFEVSEKDSLVVTGKIYLGKVEHESDFPSYSLSEENSEVLQQNEIYRELNLRGYNYRGAFKDIVKCSLEGSSALIRWENNWTSFIDNMLQMKILQLNTRSLYVPTGIRKLRINPVEHLLYVERQNKNLCPVYNYKESNVIKSGGIEISGIQAVAIHRKKSGVVPVLEKYLFVPNKTQIKLEDSVRVITQIILENSLQNNFKSVEIVDDHTKENDLLSPFFVKALDDLPMVTLDIAVSSKNDLETSPPVRVENVALGPASNLLLVVASKLLERPTLLNQATSSLSVDGFLLTREIASGSENPNFEILVEHDIGNEKLILFRKTKHPTGLCIKITSEVSNWLPQLQKVGKESELDVVVYGQNIEPEGVLGLVNCLRREPKGGKFRCCLMMDEAPLFAIEDPFYQTQLKKQMAFNVYKEGQWGTYRHLLLNDVEELEGEHFFVQNTVKGDLSSLKWVKGPLTADKKLPEGSTLVFPYYCALNFKDVMIASGRVSVDSFTTDRVEQECCQGFEVAGIDINGRRVMAMTSSVALATMVEFDNKDLFQIPDDYTMEDASTVVVVYSTVIYGLSKVPNLKPGMSILIHSATGGIGLAAINISLYHGFDVYLTVGTQEKRDYLKKHFPQFPESHIGNSRDTSFEEMIKTQTGGRGVDIVLNSLSEDKLRASIRCMAPGGHFLEIGKYDIGNDASLNLLLLERNVTYHGVMLDKIFYETKMWIDDRIREGLKVGYIKPLPRTVFEREETVKAYKHMSLGKHIGKVVIKIRDVKVTDPAKMLFKGTPRFCCDPEKSYIIVGGLGGVGLELADWLYLRGAKKLVLVSRLGLQSGYQKLKIKNWRSCGVTVLISTRNVTTENECVDLVNESKRLGPVGGIFNLAVVLKDALFEDQTLENFNTCMAPKAQATAHLDQISRKYCPELKYFVVFSSVSCGRGNLGQTNYGMANSVMERICEKRRSDGLPAVAIQWGAIGDVGLVAKMQKEHKELVIGGTLQQKISSCLQVLDKLLMQDHPVVASMVVAEKTNKKNLDSPVAAVAYILGIKDIKAVGLHTSFAELGLDSMMATEMIQILEKDFDVYITAKEVRNMTFAKLIEIESNKQDDNKTSKDEEEVDILVRYVPHVIDKTAIVDLPSGIGRDEEAATVYFLPGMEGVFNGTENFVKNLRAHVKGVEYSRGDGSIQEMAQDIFSYIEASVSNHGKFYIIGYSFGAVVATELTSMLESRGFIGHLVTIEGSPEYISAATRQGLPIDDPNEFETLLLFNILRPLLPMDVLLAQKDKYLNCKGLEERMVLARSQVPQDLLTDGDLKKQAIIALNNRLKAALAYSFDHDKIKSSVHLFKARCPIISDFADDYHLSKLCEEVKVVVVDGNHSTILQQKELADNVNKLFES